MQKLFILLIISLSFTKCTLGPSPKEAIKFADAVIADRKNGQYTEYYADGHVKSVKNYENDKITGVYMEFYTNGNLREYSFSRKGFKNSIFRKYYSNKKLSAEGTYKNGLRVGSFKDYDSLTGYVKRVRNFLIVRNKNVVNEVYSFNSKGDTLISKSYFYKLEILQHAVKPGKPYKAKISLVSPCYPNSKMLVYFISTQNPYKPLKVLANGYSLEFSFIAKSAIRDTISGFIEEVKPPKVDEPHTSRRLYFDCTFRAIR